MTQKFIVKEKHIEKIYRSGYKNKIYLITLITKKGRKLNFDLFYILFLVRIISFYFELFLLLPAAPLPPEDAVETYLAF